MADRAHQQQAAVQEVPKDEDCQRIPGYFHIRGLTLYNYGHNIVVWVLTEEQHQVFVMEDWEILNRFVKEAVAVTTAQ